MLKDRSKRVVLWGKQVKKEDQRSMARLLASFAALTALSSAAFVYHGYGVADSVFESASALSTTGLSTGLVSADMPSLLKYVMMALMVLGRVEVIPVLIALDRLNA